MEGSMKINENSGDRIIRILLALGLGVVVALKFVSGIASIILVAAAGILLLTGTIGFCAIYALLGISTCRIAKNR
jgi:hypothetical protein